LYAYSFTNVSDANRNGVQYACNAYLSFDNADESEREREREREGGGGGGGGGTYTGYSRMRIETIYLDVRNREEARPRAHRASGS